MKPDDLTKPIPTSLTMSKRAEMSRRRLLPLPTPRLPSPMSPTHQQHLVPLTLRLIPLVSAPIPLFPQKRKYADLFRRPKRTGGEEKVFASIAENQGISMLNARSYQQIDLPLADEQLSSLLRQKRSRKTRQRLRKSRRSPESALSS